MYDGKQPLLIWLTGLSSLIFQNPVIAGRLISLISGLFSVSGIYLIGKTFRSEKTGIIAAGLYCISPFFLVYDSLVLMDGLLLALNIWSVYFVFKTAKTRNLLYAVFAGILTGLGLLTKTSANFWLMLLPAGILLLPDFSRKRILKYLISILIIILLSKIIESLLRFSSYYGMIASKNSEFFGSINDLMQNPFKLALPNIYKIADWYVNYIGIGIWIFAFISGFLKSKRLILYFGLTVFIPTVIMIFMGKQLYPRHLLFMVWPVLFMAAAGAVDLMDAVKQKKRLLLILMVIIGAVCLTPLYTDYKLISDYQNAPIPKIDRWQLISGRPAGIGLERLVKFLEKYSDRKVAVMTDMPIGILPDGPAVFFHGNRNFTFLGFDSIKDYFVRDYYNQLNPDEMFLVVQSPDLPPNIKASLEMEIKRPGNEVPVWYIYRLSEIPVLI